MNYAKFVVEVDPESKVIRITNTEGKTIEVQGAVIFAGDAEHGLAAVMAHGSKTDVAWAAAFHYDNPNLRQFYNLMLAHIFKRMDNEMLSTFAAMFNRRVNAEEIMALWSAEEDEEDEILWN